MCWVLYKNESYSYRFFFFKKPVSELDTFFSKSEIPLSIHQFVLKEIRLILGPGAYEVDQKKPGSAKGVARKSIAPRTLSNLSKCGGSKTSSNTSLNSWVEADDDICFKTPSKLPIIRR